MSNWGKKDDIKWWFQEATWEEFYAVMDSLLGSDFWFNKQKQLEVVCGSRQRPNATTDTV